jgi:hypothetical protein
MGVVSQYLGSILPTPSSGPAAPASVPDFLREDLVQLMGEVILNFAREDSL